MLIKDAVTATEQARRILGNPVRFVPVEGKKLKEYWVIKAIVGILDNVLVTVKMPEKLLDL